MLHQFVINHVRGCSYSRDFDVAQTQQDLNTQQSTRLKANGRVSNTARLKPVEQKGAATPLLETPKAETVVLYYSTGWAQAKLHCSVLAGDWHDHNLDQVSWAYS